MPSPSSPTECRPDPCTEPRSFFPRDNPVYHVLLCAQSQGVVQRWNVRKASGRAMTREDGWMAFFGPSMEEMRPLKRALLSEYGNFSDKRIKNIDKSNLFIIDDREFGGYGSGGELFGWFCTIFAEVIDAKTVNVRFGKSIPKGRSVDSWVQRHQADTSQGISFSVGKSDLEKLPELAAAFLEIVRPGVRYPIAAYKYVCPRVADALNRLHKVLDGHWNAAARGL